jgi:hypothetical protein
MCSLKIENHSQLKAAKEFKLNYNFLTVKLKIYAFEPQWIFFRFILQCEDLYYNLRARKYDI